jgi:hypothetical protein
VGGAVIAGETGGGEEDGVSLAVFAGADFESVAEAAGGRLKVGFVGERQAFGEHEYIGAEAEEVADSIVIFKAREAAEEGFAGIAGGEGWIGKRGEMGDPIKQLLTLGVGGRIVLLGRRHLERLHLFQDGAPEWALGLNSRQIGEALEIESAFLRGRVVAVVTIFCEQRFDVASEVRGSSSAGGNREEKCDREKCAERSRGLEMQSHDGT